MANSTFFFLQNMPNLDLVEEVATQFFGVIKQLNFTTKKTMT
jgi:uncharacterized protein YlaN (UPF0358 family)